MKFTHLIYKNGSFKAFVMPDKNACWTDAMSGPGSYEDALERAIEEAVVVTLTDDIKKETWLTSILDENSIFEIPVGHEVDSRLIPVEGINGFTYKYFLVPVERSLPVGKEQEKTYTEFDMRQAFNAGANYSKEESSYPYMIDLMIHRDKTFERWLKDHNKPY